MSESRPGDIFQPGDLLNNTYRIQSLLGRGGTSEVYKACSEISNRIVALKALRSEFSTNDDYLLLMTREEDIRDVRHDAIVRYYDNQRMPDGQVYLVMDYIDGPGLDQKLKTGGMSADDLLTVGARVTEGLIAAHARNIVHRDLSPDNIILRSGDPSDPVIIDFGIAKDTNPGAETIVGNEFAGKYAYAAPEQLSGNTDARSDIYSLGALLLATFRGAKPDIGSNPMEVVQRKSEPVDVEGVPEPLKSLIERMCKPEPDERFQTAQEVLSAMRETGAGPTRSAPNDYLDDKTVLAKPTEAKRATRAASGSRKSTGKIVAILAAVVLGVAVFGGYSSGMFDGLRSPNLPVADPYALVIEKSDGAVPRAIGNVPDEAMHSAVTKLVERDGGTADLTIATGEISETWGDDVLALTNQVSLLEEYSILLSGDDVKVTGLTSNKTLRTTLVESLSTALPGNLTGDVVITLGPRILQSSAIAPLIKQFSTCGPLTLEAPPAIGYGKTDRILVTGKLASSNLRRQLRSAISAIAGDRPILVDVEILSESLCQIETALPKAPPGGFEVKFSFGSRHGPNENGLYFVGENPVIDVIIPAGVTQGFLWVSILDVSGNVFHLLPNLNRTSNNIALLRNGVSGAVSLRVAYPQSEATDNRKLAFLVDDSTLGKSKILVLHSDEDLFGGVRPTTESIASYAEALVKARDTGGLRIRSLDSGILTTAKK